MRRVLTMCGLLLSGLLMGAGIPEPHNLVYGEIELGGGRATRSSTDLMVEVRRFATGGTFQRYRMGTDPAAGDYYVLRLKMESRVAGGPVSPDASEVGDTVYLTVVNGSQVVDQIPYVLGTRGTARRIDFGNIDSDEDGIPDGWEQAYLFSLDFGPDDDPDADGLSNRQEYLLGLNPLRADAPHPADLDLDGRLTIQEVSAYYTAWRNGATKWVKVLGSGVEVPMGPVPIPVTYVTRATFLWERGEYYRLDPAVGPEPLWWVSAPAPSASSQVAASGGRAAAPQAMGSTEGVDGAVAARVDAVVADEGLDPEFRSLVAGLASVPAEEGGRRRASTANVGVNAPLLRVETMAASHFVPGEVVAITNVVHVILGARTYAVEHRVPAGWELVSIGSSGYYDHERGSVRWGPFFDQSSRTLVYLARAGRRSTDQVTLSGASAYDGHGVDLAGTRQVVRLPDGVGEFVLLPVGMGNQWILQGEGNVRYGVQVSEDLREWVTVLDRRSQPDGRLVFEDAAPPVSQRFYRAIRLE